MKRMTLAFLATGTALAGGVLMSTAEAGGGGPPADSSPLGLEAAAHLHTLSGQAFDEAWLAKAKRQQDMLCGLDGAIQLYGQGQPLKAWATKDSQARQNLGNRLETLRNRLTDFPTATHTDFVISGNSLADLKAHADAFFRAEYPKQSAQISALARLALSHSHNAEVRREAATILAFEKGQMNEFEGLK